MFSEDSRCGVSLGRERLGYKWDRVGKVVGL